MTENQPDGMDYCGRPKKYLKITGGFSYLLGSGTDRGNNERSMLTAASR